MTKCPAMHSFSGLKTSVGCMISLALLPLGVVGHAEMIRVGCPLTSLSLLPPQRGQIWEMPVLYGLGQQQLSTCCSACRGAQRLPGGYSCSTPSTWAKKPQELLGQPWQRHDLIPSHVKKVQISASLKEDPLLTECGSILGTICP